MAIQLYTGLGSGNAYKAELMLHLLRLSYEPFNVSIPEGEHRKAEFLQLTPFGQIPVLVDNGQVFSDSQAILCYLARAYGGQDADQWFPQEPASMAAVVRWLSVAANEIQNGPTMARAAKLLHWPIDYDRAVKQSYRLLALMDQHLTQSNWLAAEHATIADVACYPYLLLAEEGGVDTGPFQAVEQWLRRVEQLPEFWPMPRIPGLPGIPLVPVPAEGEMS